MPNSRPQDLPGRTVEVLESSPIRPYITELHRQVREMGPAPFTYVESAGRTTPRSPVVRYITDLHPQDREMGPNPATYIELPRLVDPTVRRYVTPMHHRDRDMGPSPHTTINPQPAR